MKVFDHADRARQVGLALAVASVLAAMTGAALFLVAGGALRASWMPQNATAAVALAIAFAAMVRREPHNGAVWTVGWVAVVLAFSQALVMGANELALARLTDAGGPSRDLLTFDVLPAWLAWSITFRDIAWVLGWFPFMTLALLLFPDGHLPSPRWRVVAGAAVVGMALEVATLAVAFRPGARQGLAIDDYPFTPTLELVDLWATLVLFAAVVASILSLAVRYHRASGDARRQILWVAMGAGLVAVAHLLWLVAFVDYELAEQLVWVAVLASTPALVVAYAVAILRYRLYDIDVVVSRSLVVAALAGFIAAVYVAVVVGVGRLAGVGDEPSLALKVAATAIVAVAFQPLRQRVRRWADRLVYGHRATPYEVLAGFSQTASASDEAKLQRLAEVLAAGTGAQPATVWLRVGGHIRPVASSAAADAPALLGVPLEDGDLPSLPASLVVAVRHDGELLGAVSLTKPRSEPPTPQDEELAARLARGLALVLRNARLTAELREHLAALRASRSRLVAAQDEARRAIESELRTGAQQQLDELKGRLGAVARNAATAGAVRTAALLEQLEGEADDADDTLRTLGQGIYPPLLEDEGLAVALTAQAEKSSLPVAVHAPGLPRYPADVEAAVYFSVLEALQNAAKYAHASSVHVRLEQRGDGLSFEVSDDGLGFDPGQANDGSGLTGIAARLDTIDGTLRIHSRPGCGTRITGHVPTPPNQSTRAHPASVEALA